jgi:hypothetical protein
VPSDSPEALDIQKLVREHMPELVPDPLQEVRVTTHVLGLAASTYVGLVVSYWILGDRYFEHAGFLAIPLTAWALGAVVCEYALRRSHANRVREFTERSTAAPWTLFATITACFRRDIERQRERTLGPYSQWAKARQPLKEASDEANRSAAYWRQRLEMEPDNEVARSSLETAERLEQKFRGAVHELDGRTEVLMAFFNDCEAKLSVLEHTKRDLEESKRLAVLSTRADEIVLNARARLDKIGQEFVSGAARVGRALGSLERLQLLESAGDVPIERTELVADRIIESSEQERAMLRPLSERMSS